jgi:hypothetical protein
MSSCDFETSFPRVAEYHGSHDIRIAVEMYFLVIPQVHGHYPSKLGRLHYFGATSDHLLWSGFFRES